MQTLSGFKARLREAIERSPYSCGEANLELAATDDDTQPMTVVTWTRDSRKSPIIRISPQLTLPERVAFVAGRLAAVSPLLCAYGGVRRSGTGTVLLNLSDRTLKPGLSFCGRDRDSFLVPDPVFIATRAYADTRARLAIMLPWSERVPAAIWRGATTGKQEGQWRNLPRIALCELSREYPALIDAGITKVVQLPDVASEEIARSGYMRESIPAHTFQQWQFQIDIDGNSNSWPGLFQKLLTGSPVLKIASLLGWRQWYYNRLEPWVNFVPVEADMSDLITKIEWLKTHQGTARAIGEAGRRLALSLEYESQIELAMPVIDAAFLAHASHEQGRRITRDV